jgi:ribosomal protein S18 acetylase RimI-like enzyme
VSAAVGELSEREHAALNAFLDSRIYEFNTQSTGLHDGKNLGGSVRDGDGQIVAAVTGHTWGATCFVTHLWVHAERRHAGLGSQLMRGVESEARRRSCVQILLGTHSFQAPRFYERLGFRRVAEIPDYPRGHAQLFYAKSLAAASPGVQP